MVTNDVSHWISACVVQETLRPSENHIRRQGEVRYSRGSRCLCPGQPIRYETKSAY